MTIHTKIPKHLEPIDKAAPPVPMQGETFIEPGKELYDPILQEVYISDGSGNLSGPSWDLVERPGLPLIDQEPAQSNYIQLVEFASHHGVKKETLDKLLFQTGVSMENGSPVSGLTWKIIERAQMEIARVYGLDEFDKLATWTIRRFKDPKMKSGKFVIEWLIEKLEDRGVIVVREFMPCPVVKDAEPTPTYTSISGYSDVIDREIREVVLDKVDPERKQTRKESEDEMPSKPEKDTLEEILQTGVEELDNAPAEVVEVEAVSETAAEKRPDPLEEMSPPPPGKVKEVVDGREVLIDTETGEVEFTDEEISHFLGRIGEFEVEDEESANWVVGKIRERQMKAEDIKAQADAIIRDCNRAVEGILWKYGSALKEWAKTQLTKFKTGKRAGEYRTKNVKLLEGTIQFTKVGGWKCFDKDLFQAEFIDKLEKSVLPLYPVALVRKPDMRKFKAMIENGDIEPPPGWSRTQEDPLGKMNVQGSKVSTSGKTSEEPDENREEEDAA